jgi:hypothetical protein
MPVGLPETNNEDAEVGDLAVLCESFIGGDQHAFLADRQSPKIGIRQALA